MDLHVWNDMNEPSVFNGPEVTMRKDMLSMDGTVEHREWHNLYGLYLQQATSQGLIQRSKDHNIRSFVLSRAFWAGSQRFGAIWTGDNTAEWGHLRIATPMLLSVGLGGVTFCGADVGGFFGNPDAELMIRWYQAGAFQPFFRAHAHMDSKRREPWLLGQDALQMMRYAVRLRYTFLPYLYTLYEESFRKSGQPIMKPLWYDFPLDAQTYTMDDTWLLGSDLLVKPVVHQGATSVSVYFPTNNSSKDGKTNTTVWYDIVTYQAYQGGQPLVTVQAHLHQIPVFQRASSIIPRKLRTRRSSAQMIHDPYTLMVALGQGTEAQGELYIDDEHTFNHVHQKQFTRVQLMVSREKDSTLLLENEIVFGNEQDTNWIHQTMPLKRVERIIVFGFTVAPTSSESSFALLTIANDNGSSTCTTNDGEDDVCSNVLQRKLPVTYDAQTHVLVIKAVDLPIAQKFKIQF